MYEPPRQGRPPYPGQQGQPGQPGYPGQQQPYPGPQPQYPGRQPSYPGQQPPYAGQQPYPGRPPYYQQQPPPPPPQPPPKKPRPARQRHWPYMLMLVVLLPLIAGFEFWVENKDNTLTAEFKEPVAVVAKGGTGDYKGANWKLTKFEIIPAPKGTKLPRGTRLLQATFEVTPRTAKASKAIQYCGFQAVDDQPRIWDPLVADECQREKGEYDKVPIPAGETQKVTAAFLVPTDAADKIRPQVSLGRDGALEFTR